jgi:photosystem II stability/assembly factor-like uncharacterized protein
VGGSLDGHGVILHTTDGGQTWTQQMDGLLPAVQLEGVTVVDADTAWVCGGPFGGYPLIIHSADGGQSWQRPGYQQLPVTKTVISVDALDADTVWAVGQTDTVLHTDDAGAAWLVPEHYPAHELDANGVVMIDEETIWIVVDYGGIYRSDDGGDNWTSQESGQHGHHLIRISALDGDNAWIVGVLADGYGDLGVILHTADGGALWETQTDPVNVFWHDVAMLNAPIYLPLLFRG